ncbi:protein kinase domain-containing protein [Rosistilla oblonga]|uniref:protein kinase domain-containing protein n=1 Tax=Rosistilla oblonga TaxID=2527990 RepID=UPI003A98109B
MTDSDHSPAQPDDSIEIHERIDSGLYGSVYRATQRLFQRQVAVKIIKTKMNSADALAHAAPLARANHPAIVTVYTLQELHIPELNHSVPAIVMEWVDGDTFGKRLAQSKFTIEQTALVCHDLLDGIEHLHSKGLCHGDLHAGNIIILPSGHAKIIDIDANKEISLARLSLVSQEGAKSADIDYCRGAIFKTLRHSSIPLSVVTDHETILAQADSLAALRQAVESAIQASSQAVKTSSVVPPTTPQVDWLDRPAIARVASEEVISLLDTQAYFDLLKLPYPETRADVLSLLASEAAILPAGSNWDITNLGALLFAKRLDAFGPRISRKAARFIAYDGVNKLKTKTDVPGTRGYAVGFEALVEFVHNAAPKNEYLEVAIREEFKMFPKQALRELIANAMVHQDFSIDGTALRIEMYDDRVEISNPGVPAIPADRFIDEDLSRNETMADLMRRLGVCERKGSGVDKVVDAAEVFQLPAPDFRVGNVRTTAVLFAHQDFTDMSKSARIRACYQHCVLQFISGKRMSNQSLRERFGLNNSGSGSATASQIIAAAKEKNLVKLDEEGAGSLRYARYVPGWV